MTSRVIVGIFATVGLVACAKEEKPSAVTVPAEAGATQATAGSGAARPGDAGPGTSAAAPSGAALSFAGTYSAKPSTLYIPAEKDYSGVKQAKSDDTKLVGDGALTLEVSAEGRVTGAIDSGPAAPALVDATRSGDEIRGTVRRKDPSDQGLTGVILGKIEGGKVSGKLTLAEANAATLREATFSAEKK